MKMSIAFYLFVPFYFLVFSFYGIFNQSFATKKYHFDGKYGLYVSIEGDHYQVHWLTSVAEEGYLNTQFGDSEKVSYSTPKSTIHKVQIPLNDQSVNLDFGSPTGGHGEIKIIPSPDRDTFEFKGVDSVYVLGDTHGNYDEVVQILQNSKLIDETHQWIGGNVHLVFLGDILDLSLIHI